MYYHVQPRFSEAQIHNANQQISINSFLLGCYVAKKGTDVKIHE